MPRSEDGIEPSEAAAAVAILKLAELIEQVCYHQEAQGVPQATVRELHRAYRATQAATTFYFGESSPLVWTAPDYKFKKGIK
jgi:hypothetical protein